jgi:hypothetical protein
MDSLVSNGLTHITRLLEKSDKIEEGDENTHHENADVEYREKNDLANRTQGVKKEPNHKDKSANASSEHVLDEEDGPNSKKEHKQSSTYV